MKYIAALLCLAAPASFAQQLSQEVDVEHEVVPVHRDFSSLEQTPVVTLRPLSINPLTYSERLRGARVTPQAAAYAPAAWGDTLPTSPYRGYASAGYWPAYHLDLSAGYRFLDTDKTRLSAWGQLNGANYTKGGIEYRRTQLGVGADLRQAIGHRSFIDAGMRYRYASFTSPFEYHSAALVQPYSGEWHQYVNSVDLMARWHSTVGELIYNVGASYQYFGYRNPMVPAAWSSYQTREALLPARENIFSARADARMPFSESSTVGLDVRFDYLRDGHSAGNTFDWLYERYFAYADGSHNRALLGVTPRYVFSIPQVTFDLGVNVDFAFNSGTVVRVSPDATISWQPIDMLRLTGTAKGGTVLNSLSELFDINYLSSPMFTYGFSRVPIDTEVRLLIGPRKGIWGELMAGYAEAKDWLMPRMQDAASFFAAQEMKGWRLGVRVGGKYSDLLEAQASFEVVPQKYDRGYYLWRDRAKYVAGAEVTVHPVKPLDVTLGYELRARRKIMDYQLSLVPIVTDRLTSRDLRNTSLLSISGNYRFTDRLSVFLSLDNLLSRHELSIGGIPVEGFHGLVGASYKF